MRADNELRIRRLPWFVALLLFAGFLGGVGTWIMTESAAQDKSAMKKEEVEEGDEPPPDKPRTKVPKREEVEEADVKPDETQAVDLRAEAKKATGDIQTFFTSLAVPHDDVIMRQGRTDHVEPLKRFIGPAPNFKGIIKLTKITETGKRKPLPHAISKRDLASAKHFEQIVLEKSAAFLQASKDLPHLTAAEKALVFVLRFHLTSRTRNPEDEKHWQVLENNVRARLLDVRLDKVAALGNGHNWDKGFALAEQLVKEHPGSQAVQFALAQLTLDQAQATGKVEDYVAARRAYLAFTDQFPDSRKNGGLRNRLVAAAEKLVAEAKELEEKDRPAAVDRLRRAAQIWPQLPALQDKLRTLDLDNPILYVGVKELPKLLSPATACTDAEKQAVELLFESLVKPGYDDSGGWHYEPGLTYGRPQVLPLGRRFHLAKDAFWSDGKRVIAADIRHTVRLLKMPQLPGRDPSWASLVGAPRADEGPYQIDIPLRTGFLDPLSLMTFKILPRQVSSKPLTQADDEDFAQKPVGSGPYQYQGTTAGEGTEYAVFVANPFYQRAGRRGRPFIREIRFVICKDLAQDFQKSQLQLLLDLPTSRIKDALKAGFKEDDIRTLSNRRVYFLAVNHTNEYLQNQHLRKALAHAIDREKILKTHFRAGFAAVRPNGKLADVKGDKDQALHPALNGPYPPGSWACSPSVPETLFEMDRAQTEGDRALATLKTVDLTLKYPNDDPRVEKACQAICAGVAKALGDRVKIKAEGLSPQEFRKAIYKRQYDLAYCHHDYASEAFWLRPLFDPDKNARDPGGSNYLRYQNDSQLESLFHKAMTHRDFSQVKKFTHDIHDHLYAKMPLIPLWQLHTHLAIHPRLQTAGLDPLLVFSNAEEWKLERK